MYLLKGLLGFSSNYKLKFMTVIAVQIANELNWF